MKLLDSIQVKTAQDLQTEDRVRRIKKLNQEESDAVKRLNLALEKERIEKQRLVERTAETDATLRVRKSVLAAEVDTLERKRADAMKPINDLRIEAEQFLKSNQEESESLRSGLEMLKKSRDELTEKRDEFLDQTLEFNAFSEDKLSEINARESALVSAEKEIDRLTKKLSEEWVQFHSAVHGANADLAWREKEVADALIGNQNFLKEIDQEKKNLAEDRRAIQDGYKALSAARKEILGRDK